MRDLVAILRVGRRQWGWMAAGIVTGMIVISTNALLMALSGWFVASMAVAGLKGAAFDYFMPSAGIRALALARTIGRYGERLLTHEAAFRFLADLRVWLFRRLEPLAPAGLERYASGDVAGRLRADVDSLESLYLRILAPLAVGVVSILLAALFAAWWHMVVGLVLSCALLLAGLALPLLGRRLSREPGRAAVALGGELRTAVTEGLRGADELLLLGAVERHRERVDALSRELVSEQRRLGLINAALLAGSTLCAGLGLAGVLGVGGQAVADGVLNGPELVMLLLFSAASFEATGSLPGALHLIPAAGEALRRIQCLADALPPVPDPPQPVERLPVEMSLRFRDARCGHGGGRQALPPLNLEVPAGICVALTGPSGIGKSTVIETLLRFRGYTGSIAVGGVELDSLNGDEARSLFSALAQQPHLFNATIRENILLARPGASEDELYRVLKDSGLASWVSTLPQGLDTAVGEGGSRVSGGEARRIALARALIKDAPILLLDEPTEGLDSVTEREVVDRLATRLRGKTVLLVSHRLACLALAGHVVRMMELREEACHD